VQAYTSGGGSSTWSNTARAIVPLLNPPTIAAATPISSTQIRLDWTDDNDPPVPFQIERKPAGGQWLQIATQPGWRAPTLPAG